MKTTFNYSIRTPLLNALLTFIGGFLFLILPSCQKDDTLGGNQAVLKTELNSIKLNVSVLSSNLLDLISKIETMVSDGLLSEGNGNALIVKINNAIKSMERGNTNAASGQLDALINEIEDFAYNEVLTTEQAQNLTEVAEYLVNSINGDPVITEGLIAFYPFDGNSNDGSGNDRNGIASNITFSTDRNDELNSAVSFNGDGFVRIPGIGQTSSSFSLAFWYKTVQDGSVLATDNIFMGTDDLGNQFIAAWNISIGTYAAAGNPAYFDNTWHHVVITHDSDAGIIKTYFDGVLRHNRPESGYFVGNNEDIYIGAVVKEYMVRFPYINSYFVGSIDDIYFFNRAISSSEVEQLCYYPQANNNSLINTTWDFTINFSESVSWHADVTFNADGTTIYDEPEYPGIYLMHGTWSLNGNILEYILDSSGSMGSNYQFTGTLSGNTMSGTYTLSDGTRTWSATRK